MRNVNSIDDLRRLAQRRLPRMVYDFLEGGALDENTLRRNRDQFARLPLQQRVLTDVSGRRSTTELFGVQLSVPLIVSPMGLLTVLHPGADIAIARAAAASGSIFVHSPWSGCSLEDVVAAGRGRVWAQIAFWKDRQETRRHLDRARAAGVQTLVVAGDVALSSKRDRDLRHGTGMPPQPPFRDLVNIALHPGWLARLATGPRLRYATYSVDGRPMKTREMKPWMAANEDSSASWEDIAELRRVWDGELIVKGVMGSADARMAVDHGLDGVFVSNHGGRQFDEQPASVEVLPRVADAVRGRATVIVDSGVRRGADIVKALALGADLVAAGRPFAYGLAAGGDEGVARAFNVLSGEFSTAMGFVGANSVTEIGPSNISCDFGAFESAEDLL